MCHCTQKSFEASLQLQAKISSLDQHHRITFHISLTGRTIRAPTSITAFPSIWNFRIWFSKRRFMLTDCETDQKNVVPLLMFTLNFLQMFRLWSAPDSSRYAWRIVAHVCWKARYHCTPEALRLTPPHGLTVDHCSAHDPLPLSPFSSRTDQSLREKKGNRGRG